MKGTFFSKPLEWNIETKGESWQQGDTIRGTLKIKNHGASDCSLEDSGVSLAYAEVKKVQTRAEGILATESKVQFPVTLLESGSETSMDFAFPLPSNAVISDKKSSYYLCFGKNFLEGQLQLSVRPHDLFLKIIGLMDTFYRFKQKDVKSTKSGVEFKLIPPSSREMANVDSLLLTFFWREQDLDLHFNFQVKKLDTATSKTKISKEKQVIERTLTPKEYSLGREMINQDHLLKTIEGVLAEIKIKALF